MDNYVYISENTIRHLSLHDCCCSRMYWDKTSLVLEMEWMEVLASHPDNPFDKAHRSGSGKIVLHDPVIEYAELTDHDGRIPTNEIRDFEILVFDEIVNDDRYELSLFGDGVCEPKADLIQMTIKYSSSEVMFNELCEISWFDSEKFSE